MKVVYIIPGYQESVSLQCYQVISKAFKKSGVKPIVVHIHWKNHTVSDYVFQLLTEIRKTETGNFCLFGFSLGAMIAAISATLLQPEKIYLCSLSPYFKEDLDSLQKSERKILGKNRIKDFLKYPFHSIAKEISCKVILFVGDQESNQLQRRVSAAGKLMPKTSLVRVKSVGHNLQDPNYLKAVIRKI